MTSQEVHPSVRAERVGSQLHAGGFEADGEAARVAGARLPQRQKTTGKQDVAEDPTSSVFCFFYWQYFLFFFGTSARTCPPKRDELTPACVHAPCVQLLCSKHSVFCLWEVRWKDNLPSCLQCVFSADFSPLNQDVSTFKPFHYQFQLERVTVSPAPPLSVPQSSKSTPWHFDLNCDDAIQST